MSSSKTKPRRSRILIADDNQPNVELLEAFLAEIDADIEIAVDGRDTLDKVASFSPDLILLDVMMPNVNGWQVAEALKADEATRDIPIVFLSARAMEADVRHGTDLGVESYVTKPFDPIDLMELVGRLLAERGR